MSPVVSLARRARAVSLTLLPPAVACALLLAIAPETMWMPPAWFHLVVVGFAGALAATAATAMSVIARRRHDGRAIIVGSAFSVISIVLLVHGLSTPGVMMGMNDLVGVTAAINLPLGAAILSLVAIPALRRPQNVDRLLTLQLVVLVALVGVALVFLVRPELVPSLPGYDSPDAVALVLVGAALLVPVALRAARTAELTHRLLDRLVAIGVVLLIGALYGLLMFETMSVSWWIAHALEVVGIGLVGIPSALDLRYATASRPLVGDLSPSQLVADEAAFLGGRVSALMIRLGDKDPSTEGHTRRVATLAVRLGEQLGLPEPRLRLLALGGLLHDIGKLGVPDEVLNKPGPLDDDEFAIIKTHPTLGRELLAELGGFGGLVTELVESHHERLDGRGYPNGVAAGELPIEVRVLTVADVYDALTADRVYRPAWTVERAVALLLEDSGTAFDPTCVAALCALLDVPATATAPTPVPA